MLVRVALAAAFIVDSMCFDVNLNISRLLSFLVDVWGTAFEIPLSVSLPPTYTTN